MCEGCEMAVGASAVVAAAMLLTDRLFALMVRCMDESLQGDALHYLAEVSRASERTADRACLGTRVLGELGEGATP